MIRGRTATRTALVGMLTLGLLTTAGCSSGGDDPDATPSASASTSRAPRQGHLEKLWQSDVREHRGGSAAKVWTTTEDTVVVVEEQRVYGLHRDTGEQRWSIPAPQGGDATVCYATELNPRGVGVVVYAVDDTCDQAVAVDTRRGRHLWSKPLGDGVDTVLGKAADTTFAVGEDTLGVVVKCGEVRRFALTDGTPRRPLTTRDDACENRTGLRGDKALAYREDDGRPSLALYDLDSGRRHWQRPLAHRLSWPPRILAHEPLTVALAAGKGDPDAVEVRAYDAKGRTLHVYDEHMPLPYGEWPHGLTRWLDPPIVSGRYLAYQPAMASVPAGKQVQGIDLRENRTWAMRQDSSGSTLAKIAGLAGEHRLIVLEGPAAGESSPQDTVTEETVTVWEVDMTNGHAQRLGTLTLPGPSDYAQLVRPAGVDAHHLYVYARGGSGSGTLTAYRLP